MITKSALACLILTTVSALLVAGCGTSTASSPSLDEPRAEDIVDIYRLVATFHRAATVQGLDLMMSLWTDDATLSVHDATYEGKKQIREWLLYEAGPFRPENYWIALTPPQAIRIEVQGDAARIYFESHYVDATTTAMKDQIAVNAVLTRVNRRWLIKKIDISPASLFQ